MSKILFTGTEDQAFCRHRLPMARALMAAGHEVVLAAGDRGAREQVETEGLAFVPWAVRRGSINPVREVRAFVDLWRILKRERPDIVINVALQPILYGGLCARLMGNRRAVSLFAGLGAVFINPRPAMKVVQSLIKPFLRFALGGRNAWIITQNADNRDALLAMGIGQRERCTIIPGSGIDLTTFAATPEPEDAGPVRATLMARMLWDKGIRETAEAARILKARGVNMTIDLYGAPDPENPASVPESDLQAFTAEGILTWHGPTQNPAQVWRDSHIALLPSYGEGVPLSLLEAAATGRSLVGFDAPGVRDLIEPGENGLLAPLGDANALADALETLAQDADARHAMGRSARVRVENHYSTDIIGAQLVDLVERLTKDDPL